MCARLSKAEGPGPEDPVLQERQIAAVVRQTLIGIAEGIPQAVLETLSVERITATVDWREVGEGLMRTAEPLQSVIVRAAREEIPRSQLAKAALDVAELPLDFAMIDQLAVAYAAEHSGRMVVELSSKMRETVNTVITSNVAGTLPRNVVTRTLREVIPLHSAWAESVVKASARTYQEALEAGKSLAAAEDAAARVAKNRAAALTRSRADNIARTEAMTAMNEGKQAAWEQQVANGWASPNSVKEWVEGRDPCEICRPLVGELVPYDQPFSNGKMTPPQHPRCRCTMALLPPDDDV